MQRGGRSKRAEPQDAPGPEDQAVLVEAAASKELTGTEGEVEREPTISDLVGILRAHMSQQEAQNASRREETARQEQRFKALQHQFSLLQLEVQARTSLTPEPARLENLDSEEYRPEPEDCKVVPISGQFHSSFEPKLEKLTETDDIEHFLTTFERIAVSCNWPETDWVFRFVPLLTGKARSAYVHMDINEVHEYLSVKEAILKKYDINPEIYRQRFRSTEVESGETPKELYVRLKELYEKWIQPKGKTVKTIGELIVLEQYLRMLSPELQVWVREHDPPIASKAASLVEVFVAARRKGQPWSYSSWKASKDTRRTAPVQHHQKNIPVDGKASLRGNQSASITSRQYNKVPVCYLCGQEGHTKPMCPKNPAKLTQLCVPFKSGNCISDGQSVKLSDIKVNGKSVKALIDTGSVQTLVERELVPANVICTSDTISIRCVHGEERPYPTADLYIEVQGQSYLLNVGVADKLSFPVVLGTDLPILFDLLHEPQNCNIVTRSQVKQPEESPPILNVLPFYDADLDVQPGKTRKSGRQKRREKFLYTSGTSREGVQDLPQGFKIPSNMAQMQRDDPSLAALFLKVGEPEEGNHKGTVDEFVLQNNILYHQQGAVRRLVVPKEAREMVLNLGHSIPWAGHLGKYKTLARIKRHFYWPGLRAEVVQFCRTCPQCQLTSNRFPSRAPLQPLPLINTPFERLGMDIVGPLERSKAGNRYMLVITDYATKYPEVFPLKTIKARAVAFSLVQFFSRVGFPSEIVTDQGTNFMSTLLRQVYQLLGIKGLRTTPYHPQTDGLTERFNQTLKQMLRKFVDETGSDWDQWLPYLLFAYREVPQASTGFSPFELLYGHEVRGPLALLKETWAGEEGREGPVDVVSYVLQMRERLQKMTALAQQHMAEAQKYQKTWYDKSARQRTFVPGQKVLVMLPSSESKLLAKWQGPFEIVKQFGPTTYQVSKSAQPHSTKVLHVNLLKEWTDRSKMGAEVMLIRAVEEEEAVDDQYMPSSAAMEFDLGHLSSEQQLQVRALCNPQIFKEYPGRTDILEHEIVLKDDAKAKRLSYRIPERLLGSLRKEMDLLLSLGIVEASKSEWCNPVVLVPRKDETMRFCIDFRYLNSVSKFDSYPTPRIDDLVSRVGKAKYLTTTDLCKGYWQVPLAKQSRELTAFRTPWGLFQFTVMPFGLHGAPATFQRLMDQVLRGCDGFACAYLDDIVIYSNSWEEHLRHLQEVLGRLQGAGLTINPAKCTFARSETEYLGFIIGNGELKPQVRKIHAIESCPLPQTKKQLRSFLGMAGFYHRFIPNFSARAATLTDMTGSKCPSKVQWTKRTIAAYHDIQQALGKSPTLKCPDFDQSFVLQTDASDRGLGAVLLQGGEDLQPVAFISRKLYPRELRYSTVEKEALAIKWALDSLKYYLLGRGFVLQTDHKALQWLQRMKDTNSRITRWYLAMQPFCFTVQHIPGKLNVTADYLSRWSGEMS